MGSTFLDEFSALYTGFYLLFVGYVALACEGFVQACAVVVVALGVVSA